MARYHINPETGRPNLCNAQIQCRFAVDGKEPEHYATKDEARAGYEASMAGEQLASVKKKGVMQSSWRKKVEPESAAAEARLDKFLDIGRRDYAPITDLELKNSPFPEVVDAVKTLEKVAAAMDAAGNRQMANVIRGNSRFLASADSTVRLEALFGVFNAKSHNAYGDKKHDLGDAYDTLARITMHGITVRGSDSEKTRQYLRNIEEAADRGILPHHDRERNSYVDDYYKRHAKRMKFFKTLGEEKKFSAQGESHSAREILDGVDSDGRPISKECLRELNAQLSADMQRNADALVEATWHGKQPPHFGEVKEYVNFSKSALKDAPEFSYIASGAEHNVYLHRETRMVYKVAHNDTVNPSYWRVENNRLIDNAYDAGKAQRVFQEAYAEVDDAQLRAHGIENLKTLFLQGESEGVRHSVIAQPLMPPTEWAGFNMNRENELKFEKYGVADLHMGNVMVNLRSGKIVLLDCLNIERY